MTLVALTWREVRLAAFAGIDRHITSLHNGFVDRHGAGPEMHWQIDIEGAIGEFVVSKALGLYCPIADPMLSRHGDVARLQVRTTSRPDGRLIVRPGDADEAAFVLVVGQPLNFRIAGWMAGGEAKQERWSRTDPGRPAAYFVPQSALHLIDELVAEEVAS